MDKVWGEIIQLAGLLFLAIGIGIEIYYKAHIGFITITVGSMIFAVGTKVKHKERRKNGRERNAFRDVKW